MLRDLLHLGEPGFAGAAELVAAWQKNLRSFGAHFTQLDGYLRSAAPPEFLQWCILNPGALDAGSRQTVAAILAGRRLDGSAAFALSALREEADPGVARVLACMAVLGADDATIPELAAAARKHAGTPEVAGVILEGLLSRESPAGDLALAGLSSDPHLAEELRMLRIRRDPPCDGLLVEVLAPGSPPAAGGIRRGDVIMSVDGKSAQQSLEIMVALSPASGSVAIQVHRDGEILELQIRAEDLAGAGFRGVVRKPR